MAGAHLLLVSRLLGGSIRLDHGSWINRRRTGMVVSRKVADAIQVKSAHALDPYQSNSAEFDNLAK